MNIWKEKLADKMFNWAAVLILLVIGFIMLYPFYYLIVYSLNDPLDAARGEIYLWPRIFSTISYELVWATQKIDQAAFISLSRTVLGTVASVFCTAMLAYVLSRPHLIFRRFLNQLFIVTMYVGGGLIPYYLTMKFYGFSNTFLVYVIPGLIGVFNMILIRTYIQELPASLWDSAEVDGAKDYRIFSRIILPLCKPVLAVVIIFNAVGQWNSWFDAAIFNTASPNLKPLQLILMGMLKNAQIKISMDVPTANELRTNLTPESMRAAITMIATVPIVIVYPFFQKYFTQGIMLGAIKG